MSQVPLNFQANEGQNFPLNFKRAKFSLFTFFCEKKVKDNTKIDKSVEAFQSPN